MSRKATAPGKALAATPPESAGKESKSEQARVEAHNQMLATVEAEFGDGTPFDFNNVVAELAAAHRRVAVGLIQMGKLLVRLKAHMPGRFGAALAQIGIDARFAQKAMQAVRKFSASDAKKSLAGQVSENKLLELLTLDDDSLETLANDPDAIDAIDQMSPSELRKALRAERESRAKSEQRHNAKLDDLSKKANKWDVSDAREKAALLMPDVLKFGEQVKNGLHNLQHLLVRLDEAYKAEKFTLDEDHRATIDTLFEQLIEQFDEAQKAI